MIMNATVIRVRPDNLLVRDLNNNQEVQVNYRRSGQFSTGDNVRITYDGRMTLSIPPQISAISIQVIRDHPADPPPRPPLPPLPPLPSLPSETRAVIIQRGRGFLLVRDLRNNRQMRVNFAHANHFCVRQRIVIRHDSIIMNNPPEINAIDITPLC